jgi:hypothetical protein
VRTEFLSPAMLLGLALVAVPIAIHLFARTPVTRIVVPSLRLLVARTPHLRRRRVLRDPWLLAVRTATVAAAVVAAAGPLLITPGRESRWAEPTVRAIVVDSAVASPAVEAAVSAARSGALAVEVITADPIEGGVTRGLAWLATQPPARREVVFVGDRASVPAPAAVSAIPPSVGIRVRTIANDGGAPDGSRLWVGSVGSEGSSQLRVVTSAGGAAAATVTSSAESVSALPVAQRSADADRALVDAVWTGLLREGTFLRPADTWRSIEVEWFGSAGSGDAVAALEAADRQAVWAAVPALAHLSPAPALPAPWTTLAPAVAAARRGDVIVWRVGRALDVPEIAVVLRAALAAAAGEVETPRRLRTAISGAATAIEREALGVPAIATRQEAGRDGRWLWLAALGGLAIEQWLRRRRDASPTASPGDAAPATEANA